MPRDSDDDLSPALPIGRSPGLTALGLLCDSGLALRTIVRDLPELIRRVLDVDTVGFFWCGPDGAMTDAYVEKPYFLSAEVLLSCQDYQRQKPGNWPTFTENVLAGPVAGYLIPYQTDAFYASRHYAFTYERIGARHILDAVVWCEGAPVGCWLFMRSAGKGPFSAEDIEMARLIGQLTAPALTGKAIRMPSTRMFDAGLLVYGADDRLIYHNLAAHQSLWMLARAGERPMAAAESDSLDALAAAYCADMLDEARQTGNCQRPASNRWGDFAISAHLGEAGAVAFTFQQRRPLAAHLAHSLLEAEVPPRRMTVAWHALNGLSRKENARRSGLGLDTVGEYMKALFAQFEVASVTELQARFSA